ncbi:glycosyltransferase family 39 protein [Pinirhizobacter soli]|uniref:glycosyltransferase family 39 protein n=1 Tax=Pinirhizobacter soli TaxID=2786953 RepID=UPI00202AC1FD|nr:glycosyltransferase family 39 protein [Pinirhizobacter soli]
MGTPDRISPSPLRWRERALFLATLGLVLAFEGAVPFVSIPALGMSLWISSFAQAFADAGLTTIHAHNFGLPSPAPLAFGLSTAYPQAILIFLGMHAADAYATVAAGWLGLAFWGAYRIARRQPLGVGTSLLLATLWMSMPLIWAHAPYASLSLGIALLPLYFLATQNLLESVQDRRRHLLASLLFCAISVVAIFMDGYSFVMFAVAAGIMLLFRWTSDKAKRRGLTLVAAPVMASVFAISILLYRLYVSDLPLERDSLDVFRGWGVDVSFLAWPTKGMNLVGDLLGVGADRTTTNFFGDASVWETSYLLPLGILALWAWFAMPKKTTIGQLTVIAAFGLYMSLGPSLKILDHKLPNMPAESIAGAMPVDAATMRTGSSKLSRSVPGLRNMRASYRWTALAAAALWFLVVVYAGKRRGGFPHALPVAVAVAIILNLPHVDERLRSGMIARQTMRQLDRDLSRDLARFVGKTETIAFLPHRNDFAIPYAVAVAGLHTFNISGDKNTVLAAKHWPPILAMFAPDAMDGWFKIRIVMLLLTKQADVVVIPQADGIWSDHFWPCVYSVPDPGSPNALTTCGDGADAAVAAVLDGLRAQPFLRVTKGKFFWFVRLGQPDAGSDAANVLSQLTARNIRYPVRFGYQDTDSVWALRAGWYQPEDKWVWSGPRATLELPRPNGCDDCEMHAAWSVFGASADRPVHVRVRTKTSTAEQLLDFTVTDPYLKDVVIPFMRGGNSMRVDVEVREATSPLTLVGSTDNRVLGVQLQQIRVGDSAP